MSENEVEVVYEVVTLPSKIELERLLLDELGKCKGPIPSRWKDFIFFVNRKFDYKFPRDTVKTIWTQLKNMEDHIVGKEPETIDISSSDEQDVKPKFSDNWEKKNKKNKKDKLKSGKREGITKEEEKELEKKIRKEIVLREMIKRDQEMLLIFPSEDKDNRIEEVNREYSKRMDKQRIDLIVSEKLEILKSNSSPVVEDDFEKVEENVCEENAAVKVEIENEDKFKKIKLPKLKDKDAALRKERIKVRLKTPNKKTPKEISPNSKKRRKQSDVVDEEEAEKLRRDLFIDKLIEISLPNIQHENTPAKKTYKKKSKRSTI